MPISLTCTRCWIEMTLPAPPPSGSVPCSRCGHVIKVDPPDDDPPLPVESLEPESVEEAIQTHPPSAPLAPLQPVSSPRGQIRWFAAVGVVLAVVLIVGLALGLVVLLRDPTPSQRDEANDGASVTEIRTEPEPIAVQPAPPAEPIQPLELSGEGLSPDWQVLFRSADPRHWDQQVDQGENAFARPLATAPAGSRYVRLRRQRDYVIVEIGNQGRLSRNGDDGRFGWHGDNEGRFGGGHLGIYDRRLRFEHQGEVCIHHRGGQRWERGWGFGHLAGINTQGHSWNGRPVPPCVFEIAVKGGTLTAEEQAKLLKFEIKVAPIEPLTLTGAGVSADWLVLFRSANPAIWDKDVQGGASHFARPLTAVPDNVRYLRLRRGKDYVIIDITKPKLKEVGQDGPIGWCGTNSFDNEAYHLGVICRRLTANQIGQVSIHHCTGYGFGHIAFKDDEQGFCWDGKTLPPTVLEIAVKLGDLTPEESQRVLGPIVQGEPIMPEKLEGDDISKDWLVLFRSVDPRIWGQNVDDGAMRFARTLTGLPDDLKYLRMRRQQQYVIVPMTRTRLGNLSAAGRFGWSGRGEEDEGAIHLGIYDTMSPCQRGDVCIRFLPWCRGWGFGHLHFINNIQGFSWDGKPVPPCVLEIAVKAGDLTDAESKNLLKD